MQAQQAAAKPPAAGPYYALTFVSGNATRALPGAMRAAVYRGPRDIVVEERPVPELGPDDVLLEVSHCGVCGSDLHMAAGETYSFEEGAIPGHEFAGEIVAVGHGAADVAIGDRVAVLPFMSCGGSSLVTSCVSIALVNSVYARRFV